MWCLLVIKKLESIMSRKQQMQRLIRHYRDETGNSEIDMNDVARWAISKGFKPPLTCPQV